MNSLCENEEFPSTDNFFNRLLCLDLTPPDIIISDSSSFEKYSLRENNESLSNPVVINATGSSLAPISSRDTP